METIVYYGLNFEKIDIYDLLLILFNIYWYKILCFKSIYLKY